MWNLKSACVWFNQGQIWSTQKDLPGEELDGHAMTPVTVRSFRLCLLLPVSVDNRTGIRNDKWLKRRIQTFCCSFFRTPSGRDSSSCVAEHRLKTGAQIDLWSWSHQRETSSHQVVGMVQLPELSSSGQSITAVEKTCPGLFLCQVKLCYGPSFEYQETVFVMLVFSCFCAAFICSQHCAGHWWFGVFDTASTERRERSPTFGWWNIGLSVSPSQRRWHPRARMCVQASRYWQLVCSVSTPKQILIQWLVSNEKKKKNTHTHKAQKSPRISFVGFTTGDSAFSRYRDTGLHLPEEQEHIGQGDQPIKPDFTRKESPPEVKLGYFETEAHEAISSNSLPGTFMRKHRKEKMAYGFPLKVKQTALQMLLGLTENLLCCSCDGKVFQVLDFPLGFTDSNRQTCAVFNRQVSSNKYFLNGSGNYFIVLFSENRTPPKLFCSISLPFSSLRSNESSLVLKACEFLGDVVFQDFPVEVFLQRPSIVKVCAQRYADDIHWNKIEGRAGNFPFSVHNRFALEKDQNWNSDENNPVLLFAELVEHCWSQPVRSKRYLPAGSEDCVKFGFTLTSQNTLLPGPCIVLTKAR